MEAAGKMSEYYFYTYSFQVFGQQNASKNQYKYAF